MSQSQSKKKDDHGFYSLISDKTKDFAGRSSWLFPQIQEWLSDQNGSRYFLITGKAGTGKSTIVAKLWEISEGKTTDMYLEEGFLSAIHVCVARDGESTDPIEFTNSLAKQLFNKFEDYQKEILENINVNIFLGNINAEKVIGMYIEDLRIGIGSPNVVFNKIIRGPLQELLQKNPQLQFVFLIDALDESYTKFDSNSISLLISNIRSNSFPIRFIIATRDDENIVNSFVTDKIITLSEEYLEDNKTDIFEFINLKINKEEKLKNLLKSYQDFAADLTKKSNGNFVSIY